MIKEGEKKNEYDGQICKKESEERKKKKKEKEVR